jgi:hypothetical protein
MAANRDRLAAVLAYQAEKRRRLAEYVPTIDQTKPVRPSSAGLGTNLENLSSGIGQGIVNQLEGVKSLVTDPVGTAKAAYEGVKGVVRNPAVLAEALRQTGQKAMSGPYGAGEVIGEMIGPMRGKGPMAEIDVYHGSPHRFEEFDASKIGTGEGAQAYGHGIYLAESPNVAQHYSTGGGGFVPVQGKDNVYFNGQWVQDFSDKKSPEGLAKYAMSQSSTGTTIKEKTETLSKIGRKDAADWLEKNADKFNQSKGNLYTADLPDEIVDRMLRFEMPLSEMPDDVAKLINPIREQLAKQSNPHLFANLKTVGDIIQYSNAVGLKPHERLQKAGIPGIKYLDAGSRGQGGSGTRNFVVFPGEEKKVKILKRD